MLTAHNNAADDAWRMQDDYGDGYPPSSGGGVYGKPNSSGKKPKKPKSPLWAKILIGFGILILVVSVGSYAIVNYALHEVSSSVNQKNMLGDAAAGQQDGKAALDGPLNILMVGTDERPGLDGNRADTIIILHINAAHTGAYMLSIPRDTLTQIPAFAKAKFQGSNEKINAAYDHGSANGQGREGGFELLANTVQKVTGLSFNAGAIVNFDGFEAVVNALGGVTMCVDEETTSFDHNIKGEDLDTHKLPAMVYHKGCQKLLPWQALDFVRQRHSVAGGDYGRQRHQQQFVKAIAKEAVGQGLTDPVKLQKVMTSAGKALTMDPGKASLTDWIFLLKGLGVDKITTLNTNGGQYASVKCPDNSSCQQLNKDSIAMFAAAKADTLPAFITAHPTWVSPDS